MDFDELTKAGSMMGSGGMIVMDEDTCMVDVARYFVDFSKEESCGQVRSVPRGHQADARHPRAHLQGEGQEDDIAPLEEIGLTGSISLCGLGQTALQSRALHHPVLPERVRDAHPGYCPAGVCKPLFRYVVDRKAARDACCEEAAP